MKGSKDLLSSILKTTQAGQTGIRYIMNRPLNDGLKTALHSQLREYNAIEKQAYDLARERNWVLEELDPTMKHISNMMSKTRLRFGDIDSKAAAMMVTGNTRGIIKGYKNLNQYNHSDAEIGALARKLLDCEKENIEQMQGYL